jgi:predicted ATPase/DNA-binding SARP family transcriptional activator/tetratricopeptide (TPR) repeat protein
VVDPGNGERAPRENCDTGRVEVSILGPLLVRDGERTVEVGGARLRALLIRLAADPGRWVPVGQLVEALWGEEPPADEVNALQSLVSRLRRALGPATVVESGPAGYRLALGPEAVDATRFEQLVSAGRLLLSEGNHLPASMRLRDGLGLWRGDPLPDVLDAPYAAAWAHRLSELRVAATEDLADAELRLGKHHHVVPLLEQLAAGDLLRERSHSLLVQALARSGRTADALTAYERHRTALAEELGLDPSADLQHLHLALLRGDLKKPDRIRRTNLRASLTSFVGRQDDIAQLHDLVRRSRLVTLVGAGGAGKTRLARETAASLDQVSTVGADGVWMVELAPISDPADIPSAAAGSIGARERALADRVPTGTSDALSLLLDSVSGRDVLLVLDNCEHLVDAAAAFAETLLGQAPQLHILATSREPLGIVGESLWPVRPLTGPGDGPGTDSAAAALRTDAVRLFADRASLVRPGFAVTEENVGPVSEICRRLDGLPLAIELAAARLRTMPVEAVADRLGDRFRLLTSGSRTAMPRHQTLRAVVAWSWDLLTESERRLAERMSVFPGGADPESVEAICASPFPGLADVVPAERAVDLLAALADKSLLVPIDGSTPRFRMLETIREFAAEQLAARAEVRALRDAHARYFLELAELAEPQLRGPEQLIWLTRLTAERDNLLAGLRHAADVGDAATGLRIGAALAWYWTLLGRHDEAANWLKQALAIEGERPDSAYAVAWTVYTVSAAAAGWEQPCDSVADDMIALVRGFDIVDEHPLLALVEPGIHMLRDDGEAAQAAVKRNLQHRDPWARAMLYLLNGMMAENDGDLAQLERNLPRALEEFRRIGDRWGIGTVLGALANLQIQRGELDEAVAALEEARQMMMQLRASDDEAFLLMRTGMLRLRLGDLAAAQRDIDTARRVADESGALASGAHARTGQALIDHYQGRPGEARRMAEEALDMALRAPVGPPQLKAGVLCVLACLDVSEGRLADAAGHLAEAVDGALASRDMPITAQVAVAAAGLALARGEAVVAAALLGTADNVRGMPDLTDPESLRISAGVRASIGDAEYERHRVPARTGDRPAALDHLRSTIDAWNA